MIDKKEIDKKVEKMRQEISQTRNQAETILKTAKNKIGEMLKAQLWQIYHNLLKI